MDRSKEQGTWGMEKPVMNKKQLGLVHIAKQKLKLSDEVYRDILRSYGGKESSKDLSYEGFEKVMKKMRELGFKKTRGKGQRVNQARKGFPTNHAPCNIIDLVTPRQIELINHLFFDINWQEPERRVGFIQKLTGKTRVATSKEAQRVIEALKAMKQRGYSERKGKEK